MVKIRLFVGVHVGTIALKTVTSRRWIPKAKTSGLQLQMLAWCCKKACSLVWPTWFAARFVCLNQGAYFIRQMSVHGRELHPLPREGITDVPTDGWNEERVARIVSVTVVVLHPIAEFIVRRAVNVGGKRQLHLCVPNRHRQCQ